jgi:hypothetical protein
MASAEQQIQATTAEEDVQNVVVDDAASLGVRRYFTIAGRDPFDDCLL